MNKLTKEQCRQIHAYNMGMIPRPDFLPPVSTQLLSALQLLLSEREAGEELLAQFDPQYRGDLRDQHGEPTDTHRTKAHSPGMAAARAAIAAATQEAR